LPRLQALQDRFASDELELIAVNRHDSADEIRRAMGEAGFSFRVALDGAASGAAERYDVRCYPATFVLDREARVVAVIVGKNEERLRETLAAVGVRS